MDIVVLGAGLVGRCVALACAARGLRVTIISPSLSGEASPAAAGMLAPSLEQPSQDPVAREFGFAARDRYPGFLEWLADRTGIRVPLDRNGILQVFDSDSAWEQAQVVASGGFPIPPEELRILEPALAPKPGAILHPLDGAIDNVQLLDALSVALDRSGVGVVPLEATAVEANGGDTRIRLQDGSTISARRVAVCAGAWVTSISGLRPIPVRPVRGQMVAFQARPIRRAIFGPDGYLVPRASGVTLAGATMEDAGFEVATTAEGQRQLKGMATSLCPPLGDSPDLPGWAGLRPVTPDLLPVIGADPEFPAVLYACGHSRNGVLMAPLTGDCIAALACDEVPAADIGPFAVSRFREAQ